MKRAYENYVGKILCVFYQDILGNRTKSPGLLLSAPKENRSIAYVVPKNIWLNRFDKKNVSSNMWIEDDPLTHAKFAEENVIVVKFDSRGLPRNTILTKYDIVVDYPFSQAIYGELVEKPGLEDGGGVVPEGMTEEEIKDSLLIDPDVDITDKMRYARQKYSSNQSKSNNKQYPAEGDIWV